MKTVSLKMFSAMLLLFISIENNATAQNANTSLSNLTATSINQTLQPNTSNTFDLGTKNLSWRNLYLKGSIYLNGKKMWQYKTGVNTIIGEGAGSTGSGGFNTALGSNVLSVNTTGNANVAIGEYSLQYNSTGTNNTATGYAALISNNTGFNNVATGFEALYSNTTGHLNTGNGKNALYYNTTGSYNTAIGVSSLEKNNADENTAVGVYALQENTTGNQNTAVGAYSLTQNTTGYNNTATGMYALGFNTSGSYNTANGYQALYSNETGKDNTATGYNAMLLNTTGYDNTATGFYSLNANTEGFQNAAVGSYTLQGNLTGWDNAAFGHRALQLNTTGYANSAFGIYALTHNTTGVGNTASGTSALVNNTTGSANTAVGTGADVSAGDLSNATAIGSGVIVDASAKVLIGNISVTRIGGQVGWTTFSDGRYKKNIKQDVQGLAFINSLQPITYTVDINGLDAYYTKGRKQDSGYEKIKASMKESSDKAAKIVYNGFIAQDVEKAAEKLNYNFSGVDKPQSKDGLYGLRYADFVVPLVKAVQELSKKNEELEMKNEKLKTDYDTGMKDLQRQIDELKLLMQSGNQQSININNTSASLEQNIPNPFNQSATINYTLPAKFSSAKIIVTDNNGKTIKQFTLSSVGKGAVTIAAGALAVGLYHYALYVDGKMLDNKKMEIIR